MARIFDVAPSYRSVICDVRVRWSTRRRSQFAPTPSATGDPPHFRLLGTVQAWGDGEELELGGPLQRALLALLLLNVGRVVSREQLIDGLWETEPPPRAARSLETKVSRLRATLGDRASVVARDGAAMYSMPPIDEVDLYRGREHALDEGRSGCWPSVPPRRGHD